MRCQQCKAAADATWLVDYPVATNIHRDQAATWHVDLTPSGSTVKDSEL